MGIGWAAVIFHHRHLSKALFAGNLSEQFGSGSLCDLQPFWLLTLVLSIIVIIPLWLFKDWFLSFSFISAVVGLCLCFRAFSSCGKWGLLFSCSLVGFSLSWLLLWWNLWTQAHGFSSSDSRALGMEPAVVAHGLSCGSVDLPWPGIGTRVPCLARWTHWTTGSLSPPAYPHFDF